MSIIAFLSTIIFQILVYSMGVYVLFHEKIRNIGRGVLALVICSVGYFLLDLNMRNRLLIDISAIIILWTLLGGVIHQKFWIVIKGVFIISCSEEIVESILNLVTSWCLNLTISSERKFFLANIILILVWIIGINKKKKFKDRKYNNITVMIGMGVMAAALVTVTASIHYAEPYVNSKRFSLLSDILVIISYFGIVFWGIFIIYIREMNAKYKHLLETEHLLRTSQKNNYEVMLAKEEETKEFRHDINNHIMCLKELMKDGNIDSASKYIDQMQFTISKILKKNYVTGNGIIDAIINYHTQTLEEDVDVNVTGFCNVELNINNVELCSIVSNPLQNAIEALINQQQGKKYLKIKMDTTKQNLKLEIYNSFESVDILIIDGLPMTKKKDMGNHGIGLKNVKKLVEKNDGLFKVDILRGEFRVTLILPIKGTHFHGHA